MTVPRCNGPRNHRRRLVVCLAYDYSAVKAFGRFYGHTTGMAPNERVCSSSTFYLYKEIVISIQVRAFSKS